MLSSYWKLISHINFYNSPKSLKFSKFLMLIIIRFFEFFYLLANLFLNLIHLFFLLYDMVLDCCCVNLKKFFKLINSIKYLNFEIGK